MDGNNGKDGPSIRPLDISKSTLSVNAPVFVPRGFGQPPAQQVTTDDYSDMAANSVPQYRFHGTAIDRIKQAESILTAQPGSFDDIMKPLTDSLTTTISNEKTLVSLTEEIFKQCVAEPNFRYTGARLCNYLSHHLNVSFQGVNFQQQLLKRCHEEHQKREEFVSQPNSRVHLQGFMLFMAELLVNMTMPEGGRIPVLAIAVKELVLTLLNSSDESNQKSVVQVLKLSGQYLEPEGDTTKPLDIVFSKIESLLEDENLNRSIRNMLTSVVTLRSTDWGRKETSLNGSGLHNPYANENPYEYQQNPYAGGNEEYSQHYYPQNHDTGSQNYSQQDDPDELDDEMASAYEEFLKETGQAE